MKAAIRKKYGPPETLKVETIDKPVPKENEVLIRVYATTVNRTDCAVLTGKPWIMRLFTGLFQPKNPTPGTDFAGIVVAIGKNVSQFQVNDKVWGFNDEGLGSQAEYMCLSTEAAVSRMPENSTFEQAAASLEGAHYAYNFINKINIQPGQKILVNGATGAIGSALVQMLKYLGAHVTATCSTPYLTRIQALGTDRIIDYTRQDFTKDTNQYDLVLDAVGKSTFSQCKGLLREKGVYISSELGPWVQNPLLALTTPLLGGKKVIFPVPSNIKGSMAFIHDLIEKGKFQPLIDRNYPLEDIAAAYQYVASGQKIGNVVILMP
jgi:NADPH:quinone reductase-like Zn-dependent oxidoreductase